MNVILIFIGGGLGSILRYLTNIFVREHTGNDFPFGTLLINIAGSLVIGLAYGLIKKASVPTDHIAAFVMVGICGGFTTFSAFSLDFVTMVNDGKALPALTYVLASVTCAILATFMGIWLTKLI